ncbi:MAG TPA: sigma-54 dependent transcriptional regulator [Longimicrobiaceae bacterium]|nr:sigma-54 dependent transcriptional regulator [Longimicrobiaceae bacterium]
MAAGVGTLRILVVDDDLLLARLVKSNLERPGRIRAQAVTSAEEALSLLAHERFDAVLTDLVLPGMSGIELVQRIREADRSTPLFIMTAQATVAGAVDGIRAGATDFIPKPVNADALLDRLERTVAERPADEAASLPAGRPLDASAADALFGSDPRLEEVRRTARRVAEAPDSRVLITGESGTGKSLLARLIHDLSAAPGRFVEVNCAALPPMLLESELFGHEKGAFTDASALKRGLIEVAQGGTIFLDEIGTMPPELQAKLLLFLETREIRRVGGVHPIPVRTRVVAATNRDLHQALREGTFRHDLLYRLDVVSVEMPPLREMPAAVRELAERFTREICSDLGRPVPPLTPASFVQLAGYPWPGNARELRNCVERALVFHGGGVLTVLPPVRPAAPPEPAAGLTLAPGLSLDEVERRYLRFVLERGAQELREIAESLGISRKTLWEKRRRHGL